MGRAWDLGVSAVLLACLGNTSRTCVSPSMQVHRCCELNIWTNFSKSELDTRANFTSIVRSSAGQGGGVLHHEARL